MHLTSFLLGFAYKLRSLLKIHDKITIGWPHLHIEFEDVGKMGAAPITIELSVGHQISEPTVVTEEENSNGTPISWAIKH